MATSGGPEALLISGGYSPEVRFHDAYRGNLCRTLTLQDLGHVNRLAVSPDGQHLAVAGNPHVRLFEIHGSTSSEHVGSFEGHTNNVTAVGFEATAGRFLYTSSEDGTIRVWDSRSKNCQLSYENIGVFEKTAVHSVDLHPNQIELIAGDTQGKVLVWDLVANRIRRTLIPEEGVPVRSVCIAPDGRTVVCANHLGTCYVWRLSDDSFEPLQKIDAHSSYVLRCVFSPDAKHLATTSADGTTCLWRSHAEGFARCLVLTGHTKWVWDGVFSKDGQYLLTGSSDCTCRLWDVRGGQQRFEFGGSRKGITAVALVDAWSSSR
jgi:G protein beta subunit-like protein|eukprot:TRINITY_DN49969_c0_g1_i1.p1 TRINITY_DN49969_c0_g1~~TRINITY_DN49969_c0_g1_i1.p1  ORF type:complete len:320 (-),score=31.91 TRINITY_DN49969_c0_g1_i1:133-1092(-)